MNFSNNPRQSGSALLVVVMATSLLLFLSFYTWRSVQLAVQTVTEYERYNKHVLLAQALLEYALGLYQAGHIVFGDSEYEQLKFLSWPLHEKSVYNGVIDFKRQTSTTVQVHVTVQEQTQSRVHGSCVITSIRTKQEKHKLLVSNWHIGNSRYEEMVTS